MSAQTLESPNLERLVYVGEITEHDLANGNVNQMRAVAERGREIAIFGEGPIAAAIGDLANLIDPNPDESWALDTSQKAAVARNIAMLVGLYDNQFN